MSTEICGERSVCVCGKRDSRQEKLEHHNTRDTRKHCGTLFAKVVDIPKNVRSVKEELFFFVFLGMVVRPVFRSIRCG